MARPMSPPAPVTIATLSASRPLVVGSLILPSLKPRPAIAASPLHRTLTSPLFASHSSADRGDGLFPVLLVEVAIRGQSGAQLAAIEHYFHGAIERGARHRPVLGERLMLVDDQLVGTPRVALFALRLARDQVDERFLVG